LALALITLAGCAPTLSLTVRRPPTLNTAGIKRIAITPFDCGDNDCREAAKYATVVATDRIRAQNYFTLVDPAEIDRLRRNGQSIENYVDAVFKGQVTRVESQEDNKEGSYKTKDGDTVYYTTYETSVKIDFSYSLTRARDGSLIGPLSKSGSDSESSDFYYPSAQKLMRNVLDLHLKYIGQDLAPHTVIEHRTFVSEKSQNKALTTEMKEAIALVKRRDYKQALESYLQIFDRYKNIAAAENAAILHEYFGDAEAAAKLIQHALNITKKPKERDRARGALARLNITMRNQATLADEYGGKSTHAAKIAVFASAEIQRALPENAIVWVHNNSPENAMAGAVIDDITTSLIKKGTGLVARDRHSAALIEAEQILQMSGAVNDNDIVRIGNAAGANTIVFIGITGTGAMRRLQVRVLDVEKMTTIMQSDAGEMWQL
jgi:tetratricopeptide (TPR) repeat protein